MALSVWKVSQTRPEVHDLDTWGDDIQPRPLDGSGASSGLDSGHALLAATPEEARLCSFGVR